MPEYGTYCSLNRMKRALGITDTLDDAELLSKLESVSRWIDDYCRRWFYLVEGVRYFRAYHPRELLIDDLVAVTSVATDGTEDRSYSDVWQETDYDLEPYNSYPKESITVSPIGNYLFPVGLGKGVKIDGSWGYGDGSSSPWRAAGVQATCLESATAVELTSLGDVSVGHVLRLESEQVYVTAVSSGPPVTITVVRGINGTAAGAHGAAAVEIAAYPRPIEEATIIQTSRIFRRKDAPFGIVGSSDVGQQVVIGRLDPDVRANIAAYCRREAS